MSASRSGPAPSRAAQPAGDPMQAAVLLRRQGRLLEADALCAEVLRTDPRHVNAYHLRGLMACERGEFQQGIELIGRSLELSPHQPDAHANLGNAMLSMGRFAEALGRFDEALRLKPDAVGVLNNRGLTLVHLGRLHEALRAFESAGRLDPRFVPARQNHASVLTRLGRHVEALDAYSQLLLENPNDVSAILGQGNALLGLDRLEEARERFTRALDIDGLHCDALLNRGVVLHRLRQLEAALADYESVLRLSPRAALALGNSANVLLDLGRSADALRRYDASLEVSPANANTLCGRGVALLQLNNHAAAAKSFESALALVPDHGLAQETLLRCRLACCDWTDYARLHQDVHALLRRTGQVGNPVVLMLFDDPQLQQTCARNAVAGKYPPVPNTALPARPATQPDTRPAAPPQKIRVAYLSADFREHPVARLLAGVLEQHDRQQFEILGFSLKPGEGGAFDRRLRGAFDIYQEVAHLSDVQVVESLRKHRVDIAIDLMGLTEGLRLSIFAHQAAPVQVAYLGYAGSTGAPYMQYLIADSVAVPEGSEDAFDERLVRLPDCFLPYDDRREIGPPSSRLQAGLPEHGFVFCAFTQPHKINPPVFDAWMRLLRDVPGSVLWLKDMGAPASANLRKQAELRGVSPGRLVFAPRVSDPAEHLARQALADLYLDTLPYNAHSTACDALWAGVPVLTCKGSSFASRVAASALAAAGLSALVAQDLDDYAHRGRELAQNPERLQAMHRHLIERRGELPLFDTARYTQHLEAALRTMHERAARGEPAAAFTVPRDDSRVSFFF